MRHYRIKLATPDDDDDLRQILAETPMAGRISVSFHREPSYFAAAVVDGGFRQVVAAQDDETNRLVGFGSRSIRAAFVNGRPEAVGYLSSLRLLAAHRNQGLLARGFKFFHQLHADGRARVYLTTIAEGNDTARTVLTSGRAGLPAYHFAGFYRTAAVPLARRRKRRPILPSGVEIRPATGGDVPALLAFLETAGPRRQFFPCSEAQDFFTRQGAFQDLQPADLLLAFRNGQLVGTLAGWDQHGFRQTVVNDYSPPVRWARPLYNSWARYRGLPCLPAPGKPFRYLTAALPLVADDRPDIFAGLLEVLRDRAAAGPWDYLLIGLHESDPLLAVVRDYRALGYTTGLYLVCWEDGEEFRARLDGRVPYLELGSL